MLFKICILIELTLIILIFFQMDLKNMFQQQQRDRPSNNGYSLGGMNQRMSRDEAVRKGSSGGGALNRYKKQKTQAGKAPAGQFKKYMLEGNNVFYENRPELKKMQDYRAVRWGLIFIWVFLALSYFIIGRIKAYDGICPKHARCGVFVHCADFFEYNAETNTCVIKQKIVNEVWDVCEAQVYQLQYTYGDNQCRGQHALPQLNMDTLFNDLEDPEKRRHYQSEARSFFRNPEKQKYLGFELNYNTVEPTIKRYSLSCRMKLYFSNPHTQLDLVYVLVGFIAVGLVCDWVLKKQKINKMYNFLRDKVMAAPDKTLNVTHTLADLQAEFRSVDQATWDKINDLRTQAKEIGYYQDDFLYWKAM